MNHHRRVIVTGAAGFIGFHLCRRLLDDNCEVIGVDNLVTGREQNFTDLSDHPGFSTVIQDIAVPLNVSGPVDCIFDMACPASPVDFEPRAIEILHTCSTGVRVLLELADEKEAVFCHASTSECYGDPDVTHHPQSEDYWGNVNPIGIRSPYDEGKRFAEALIMAFHRTHGVRTRMARIFNTYGPRMRSRDGRVLPNFINQALRNEPLTVYGDGSQTRSFCFVEDLVDGLIHLSHGSHVEPINLGSPEEVPIRQVAEEVIRLTGSASEIKECPMPADDPKRRRPDITRAKAILDWQPRTSRQDGFAKTVEYFKNKLDG